MHTNVIKVLTGFSRGKGKGKLRSYVFSKSCLERVNNHVDKAYLINVMSLDFLKITTKKLWLSRSLIVGYSNVRYSLSKKLKCHRMRRSSHGLIIGENQTRYGEYPK